MGELKEDVKFLAILVLTFFASRILWELDIVIKAVEISKASPIISLLAIFGTIALIRKSS